jgi:hypothetical protein
MSFARKNSIQVFGSIVLMTSVAAMAGWQFYRYVTFSNSSGALDIEGGSIHLLFSIALAAFACLIAFLVFSVFLRHDTDDDLHITSAPPRHLKPETNSHE